MGTGLSAAAGLNAYVPFVLVGLVARFTDVLTLPDGYGWIESPWAIAVASLLLLSEIVLDKIPAVDSINDIIGTAIRPATGGLVFAAAQAGASLDDSTWMQDHAWVGAVLGVAVAGVVHATKAVSRPVVNVSTGGVGGPIVSTAEDASSIGISLIALFAPVLVILVLVVIAWIVWRVWRRVARRRRRAAWAADAGPVGRSVE